MVMAVVFNNEFKPVSILKVYGHFIKQRASQNIVRQSGSDRIEAHSAENIPCRHLPRIIIAADACRCGVVLCVQYLTHLLLCFPR